MTTLCNIWQQRAEMPVLAETRDVPEAEPHPAAGAAPADIVAHLLHAHHRSLRERLLWIETLLDKASAHHPAWISEWQAWARKFAELHQELVCCLLQERCVIFPQITPSERGASPGLRDAIRVVGKSHARCLTLLWALIDQVAGAAQSAPEHEAGEALGAELSDLRDDYYQHLYEEECLLFPQFVADRAMSDGVLPPCVARRAAFR